MLLTRASEGPSANWFVRDQFSHSNVQETKCLYLYGKILLPTPKYKYGRLSPPHIGNLLTKSSPQIGRKKKLNKLRLDEWIVRHATNISPFGEVVVLRCGRNRKVERLANEIGNSWVMMTCVKGDVSDA